MTDLFDRRSFLVRTGLLFSGELLASAAARTRKKQRPTTMSWAAIRRQFNLDPQYVHLGTLLLASHPKPVRDAIDRHRRELDRHPVHYLFDKRWELEANVLAEAARYLGVDEREVALTDSTTMGLATLYSGLKLKRDQEAVATVHCHYSTRHSLGLRSARTGARVREISLYKRLATVTEDEIVDTAIAAIRPETRVLAVTWVHSSTGLMIPVRRIADALVAVNRSREEANRVLLCVDGVHGFGVANADVARLGCDFFVAGCHKWLYGPRGTGLVWGKSNVWQYATPTIPTFSGHEAPGREMTPGGFHSFEHRWALADAFAFHSVIGKERISERIAGFAQRLKEDLAKIPGVAVYTPMSRDLSAGLVCFELANMSTDETAEALWSRRIVASVAPYENRYLRFAPGITTTDRDIDRALAAVRTLAGRGK